MAKTYTVVRKKSTYYATFAGGIRRRLRAVNKFQAQYMADGLAKSNGWSSPTVARAA